MKYVDKIIFRDKETYNKLYQGSELLFKVQKEVVWKGLTFTALEPSTIQYTPSGVCTAQYSYDAVNWETADKVTINLNTGDNVYFKGTITGNQSASDYAKFTMTGKISSSGSIMSMQNGNPQDKSLKYNYEFFNLFEYCSSLVTAPELPANTLKSDCYNGMFWHCINLVTAPALPATTLTDFCYQGMFGYCENLVTAPELPVTTLKVSCYTSMFTYCKSLINPPKLPSTTLEYGCYAGMFSHCKSLINPPKLPAKKMKRYCYQGMFSGCTSIETAPELPSTTLEYGCYENMFKGCSKLNYIKCDAMEYNSNYFSNWVKNVPQVGDFYCYDSSIFPTGVSGIPTGWAVHKI